MAKYASKVVGQAQAWLGSSEGGAGHKEILSTYNTHKPLARGYKVKSTDAWCATFVSAVAIKLGYTDIIPTECSCQKMIEKLQKVGAWVENENRTPAPGDIIFYDWDDNGAGDNKGNSDHVGIIEKVSGGKITVIEGNINNTVGRRTIDVNGRYIRGYGVPAYDKEKTPEKAPAASSAVDPAASFNKAYGRSYMVTASGLNLRAGASTYKPVLRVIPRGEKVTCYGYYTKNGTTVWLYVQDKTGKVGFVSSEYVK